MDSFKGVGGVLYVVATPIGNMGDLTHRAEQILNSVDCICCEDTRHSARLMDYISCKTKMISLHEHNERERSASIVDMLKANQSVALISDAGTPLISDPGYILVNHVVAAGLSVIPIPGVSAVITALSISGLATDRWTFEGFLPNKSGARKKRLGQLSEQTQTYVFYESSHRIADSLADMKEIFGADRQIVVARELTKTFETHLRGTIEEVHAQVLADSNQRKGEFVVLVSGKEEVEQIEMDDQARQLAHELKELLPPKKASQVIAKVFGGNKKVYYDYLVELNKD